MAQLAKGSTINGYQIQTTDIHKHEIYLPLAGYGWTDQTAYVEIKGTDLLFTPANYAGYNFYFEVVGKSSVSGNNVDFQLYNKTDAASVSVLSTTNNAYTRLRSASLTMPTAEKTLCLRIQAAASTAADCVIARLVLIPA